MIQRSTRTNTVSAAVFLSILLAATRLTAQTTSPLAKAQALHDSGHYAEAAKAYEAVAADETLPIQTRATAQANAGYDLIKTGQAAEAEVEFRKLLTDYTNATALARANAQSCVAVCATMQNDQERAIKEFRKALALCPKEAEGIQASVTFKIADCHEALGRPNDAMALYDEFFRTSTNVSVQATSAGRLSFIRLLIQNDKPEDALTQCRWIIDHPTFAVYHATAYANMGTALERMKKDREAMDAYCQAVKCDETGTSTKSLKTALNGVLQRLDTADTTQTVHELRALLATKAAMPPICESLQLVIGRFLIDRGTFDQALFEGTVLVDVCSSSNLAEAVDMLSVAIKAQDGNLVRMNKFLEYQKQGKFGPDGKAGTADDLSDPLAGVTCPDAVERDKVYGGALAAIPKNWTGRLARANLYRYWGRPKDALKELQTAFAICPADKQPLQRVTDRTVELLVQVSGDPKIGERFVSFQKYGTAGADGKAGTEDDLVNPFTEYAN